LQEKFTQAPLDRSNQFQYEKTQVKKRKTDAPDLKKFMAKVEPIMNRVLEDNIKNQFIANGKEEAAKRNAVEVNCNLEFPK
jgi:hypothetical protein